MVLSFQNAKALKAKKEEGNKAFKEGNFEAAYDLYSEALTIDPNNIKTNAKLYCNRATVGSKVSNTWTIVKKFSAFKNVYTPLMFSLVLSLWPQTLNLLFHNCKVKSDVTKSFI